MTLIDGRQFKKAIISPFFLRVLLVLGVMGAGGAGKSYAALQGALTGTIEGAYIYTDLDQAGVKSSTREIQQRYNLRYFQNLFDSRLGNISGGLSWVDDQTSYSAPVDQGWVPASAGRRYRIQDYNLSFSLFPQSAPLTLYAQKTDREDQFSYIAHDTVSTYGFAWVYSPAELPRIGINAVHTSLTSDRVGMFPASDTDFLTLDTGGSWRNYSISARYLYNQTKDQFGDSSWAHGVNLSLNGAITSALTLGAYANYASRGGNAQGFGFSQENALGASLYYLPNRYWDGNLRFDFNESPGPTDFKRYLFSGGLNLHPTGKLDIFNGVQYTLFESATSQTGTVYASTAANYRPFFGLNLNAGLSGGTTEVTGGGASSTNNFGQANWSATYFKIFQLLRVNTSYGGSVGENDSTTLGESRDITNSISAGVDNTQTQIIHVGLNGSLTQINRSVPTQSQDQRETRLSATADSRYFRELIFYGDILMLDGTITYLDITGFGIEGRTVSEDFHANYQFLNMFTLLGAYSHIEYPQGFYGNSVNIYSVDFLGTIRPWINGLLTFSLKELVDEGQTLAAQKTFEGQARLSHQLGLLTLSTEYNYLRTEVGSILTVSQQFLVRAIRSF